MKKTINVGVAAALGLLAVTGANAAALTVGCSTFAANKVDDATACTRSATSDQQDVSKDKPLTVNTEKFFTFTDWGYLGKIGDPKNEKPGLTGDQEGQSGDYNLTNFAGISTFGDLMLVFKSGEGTFITGYLLKNNDFVGEWDSMFKVVNKHDNETIKDVSHIAVYGRTGDSNGGTPGGGGQVPLPGTLALLAAAGLGIAAVRGRKAR